MVVETPPHPYLNLIRIQTNNNNKILFFYRCRKDVINQSSIEQPSSPRSILPGSNLFIFLYLDLIHLYYQIQQSRFSHTQSLWA